MRALPSARGRSSSSASGVQPSRCCASARPPSPAPPRRCRKPRPSTGSLRIVCFPGVASSGVSSAPIQKGAASTPPSVQMIASTTRFYVLFVLALLAAATLVRAVDPFFVRALRLIAFDSYQQLAPQAYDARLPVRIVDIDEESLAKLGQWPWPRTTIRDLLQVLARNGAAAVGFDVLFSEPDRTSVEEVAKRLPAAQAALLTEKTSGEPTNDEAFAAALKETPSVLAASLTNAAAPP